MKTKINTEAAPAAIGPYSQAISAGGFLYISGQLPIDPNTGEFAGSDITSQTQQSLKNLEAIAKQAGSSLANVVKTTCLLSSIDDFADMNAVYEKYLGESATGQPAPARAAFAVKTLPKNALIEIEAIVAL